VICERCGADNRAGRRFCRACGAGLAASCPSCGTPAEPGDRFCGSCGAELSAEEGAAGAGATPATLGGAGPAVGPTERRVVSVLFADLVGFTALSDDRDPEAVREFLDRYFGLARERIGRYGGTIEKFIGDAVMAVWGTPITHEDDAERAVRAALDLADAVAGLTAPDGTPIAVRAAVLTGEAAVAVGADGQGMVAGDLVNTASRLQAVAPPGGVLVGEATVRASEQAIVYEAAGETVLRGKSAPVEAWRAVRVVAGRKGAGRSGRLEPPFVGRDDELRLLKELFHATARERRPRLVSVTGIAGIGKSRLAWELEKYIDGLVETVFWHQGRSPAYGEGLAFWALAEMVRGRARIAESDDAATATERLRASLAEHIPDAEERAWVEPRLAALLGLAPTPGGGTEELYAAWRTLFERLADRDPTILVFEDIHWADPGLIDFIEALLSGSRNRPIFVVTLARPELLERRPTWGAGLRNFSSLELDPLAPGEMDLLLLGIVPGIPPEAIRAIRDRAEGVPLYAVETVRMLLDQGRLTETDGRYRLSGELGALAVPDTLTGLLGARLDALPERERRLVTDAAVLGQSFTLGSLVDVSGLPEAEVRTALDALIRSELVYVDDDPRSPERGQYEFVQGLLREVAYGRLSRRERFARHLAAGAHFQLRDDPDLAGVLASHLLEAVRAEPDDAAGQGVTDRARTALLAAADRARSLHANERALGYLADAAAITSDPEARMGILEITASVGSNLQRGQVAEDLAREVLAWHRERGDRDGISRSLTRLGGVLLGRGNPQAAADELAAGLGELGAAGEDDPATARLGAELARAQMMCGRLRETSAALDRVLPIAERIDARETIAELLATRGWVVAASGRLQEALAILRGSLAFAEREGFTNAMFRSRMNLSSYLSEEDPREAFRIAFDGVEIALRRGYDGWASSLLGNAAECALVVGEWTVVSEQADRLAETAGDWPWGAAPNVARAILAAYRGDDRSAAARLDEVRAVTAGSADPQIRSAVLETEARIDLAAGRLEDALTKLGAAREVIGETGGGNSAFHVAIRAAVWARDPAALEHVLADARREARPGRWVRTELDVGAAASAALDGRSAEAEAIYERAIESLRALRADFQLAQALADRAILLPDRPGAAADAAEARAILEPLGARPFLAHLPDVDVPPAVAEAAEVEEHA
jgi:class 3 adenylate cyclase/tetratricopeptide (TPR) repeat protein